jgi:hypothetical protein
VPDEHTIAFDLTLALGNYELASYVFMCDLGARKFSKRKRDIEVTLSRYRALMGHLSPAGQILIHARKSIVDPALTLSFTILAQADGNVK